MKSFRLEADKEGGWWVTQNIKGQALWESLAYCRKKDLAEKIMGLLAKDWDVIEHEMMTCD